MPQKTVSYPLRGRATATETLPAKQGARVAELHVAPALETE